MKKLMIGFLLTAASLIALVGSIYWYDTMFSSSNWMNQAMGSMMGGNTQTVTTPGYMFFLPLLLFVPLIIGILIAGYFSLYPEIPASPQLALYQSPHAKPSASFETVLQTMKPEEKQLLEILKSHNGVCLQKNLRQESGLTRLKVHRIVARLAERGIITVKEQGNTNEITLGTWLQN